MKQLLVLAGVGVAGYGAYLLLKKKKGCGCSGSTSKAKIVKIDDAKKQLYPSQALESFNTDWHKLFPTPTRLGVGALPLDDTDTFTAVNFVQS